MPSTASLAAHFAASPPVTGPLNFIGLIEQWLHSVGGSIIGTPEAKAAVKKTVMDVYDALTANVSKSQPMLGAIFGMFRPTIDSLIDSLLNSITPQPVTPPKPVVVPAGSAAP